MQGRQVRHAVPAHAGVSRSMVPPVGAELQVESQRKVGAIDLN
jgi:hypothetical protein